ncbi:MAG: alginate export family protein [Chlorobi bacterium]|nr:alginate export family protein [Chlorobiota bacterium]
MNKFLTVLIIGLMTITTYNSANAEDAVANDWKFNGHFQLRTELDGRDFNDLTHPVSFSSLRTRLGVQKQVNDDLFFNVQLSDSRILGGVQNTLASSNNLDLHQAYVKLKDPLGLPISLQAGRFEMSYGTQRFIGAVGWHYVGRSFDGARVSFKAYFDIDVFATTHSEFVGYIGNPNPDAYAANYGNSENRYSMYGFWAQKQICDHQKIDLFAFNDRNRAAELDRYTLGFNHFGTFGDLKTIVEAGYQTGTLGETDIAAYLASVQAKYKIGIFSIGAGFDMLSGNDTEDEANNAFLTNYGTNHKFYGFMDYFINVPGNTANMGLNDAYLMLNYNPKDCKFKFGANFHLFTTNQANSADETALGNELDLTIKYMFTKGTAIVWGGSVFMPGDLMMNKPGESFSFGEDNAFWTYIMISTSIN